MNIICDLDGTIALDHGRAHFLHMDPECTKREFPSDHNYVCSCRLGEYPRDWDSYFAACDTDVINRNINSLLSMVWDRRHRIFILSGRSMSASEKTTVWLEKYHVPYHYLKMRNIDDRTDDHILKLKWAADMDLTPDNTLFVLEDRTRVVNAWRAAGFTCFQVEPGDF